MSNKPAPGLVTRHLRITGRVQGVGYRWSMVQAAQGLGLRGWVRNLNDGAVEAVVQGPAALVQSLITWAQHGPTSAKVDRVAVTPMTDDPVPSAFEQR